MCSTLQYETELYQEFFDLIYLEINRYARIDGYD